MAEKRLRSALLDRVGALTPTEDRGSWGPYRFYGTQDVNGADGPWFDSPIGSIYSKRTTALASMFFKVSDDGDTNDWVEVASKGALPISLWGAVGDGSTDDTSAFSAAFAALSTGDCLTLQHNATYKITSKVTIAAGIKVIGNNAKILYAPSSNDSDGKCLYITASDVWIDGIRFDGSSMPTADQSYPFYAIFAVGALATHISDVHVTNCKFDDLEADGAWTSGGTIPPSQNVSHGIYCMYVDYPVIANNRFDSLSGSAIYIRNCADVNVVHNKIVDTQWYSINLDHDVDGALIFDNVISGTRTKCRYWGGSINLAGNNAAGETLEHIIIANNRCYGTHSYTAVIVVNSSSGVLVDGNVTKEIVSGTATATIYHVSIQTEGIGGGDTGTHVPCHGVSVINNIFRAGGPDQRAIWASNTGPGSDYASGLTIRNNHCYSLDETAYFNCGVSIHGYEDGYRNIDIEGNYFEVYQHTMAAPGGAIGLIATNSNGWVYDVNIKNNVCRSIAAPTHQSWEVGLYVGAYVDRVSLGGNHWKSFEYAVRKFTNSGSVFSGFEDDIYVSNTYTYTTEVIQQLTQNSTTPDVTGARIVRTNNNQATLISNFTGGVHGQTIKVIITDTYTDFDFTSSYLKGNAGVDWTTCTTGDHMVCTHYNGSWYCDVSDNTA